MTKKNKKVEQTNEGLADAASWVGRKIANTGIAGSTAKDWATGKDAYIKAQNKFVFKLKQALDSAIDSGTITGGPQAKQQTPAQTPAQTRIEPTFNESKDVVDRYLGSLSAYMNDMLVEARVLNEATIADFVKRFIKANGAYDWANHDADLNKVASDFETAYAKNKFFFPTDAAKKVFDFLYSVGAQAQRDKWGDAVVNQNGEKTAQLATPTEPVNVNPMKKWIYDTASKLDGSPSDERTLIILLSGIFGLVEKEKPGSMMDFAKKSIQVATSQAQAKTQTAESKKLRKKSV